MVTESLAQRSADAVIRKYRTSTILVRKYVSSGVPDRFGQAIPVYAAGLDVVGRAIHHPTKEQISFIGDAERYGAAFLFSRLEMLRKFPGLAEGKWITTYDRIVWNGNDYKLEKVQPSGQVGRTFSLVIALGNTPEGERVP
jgi:hypothetical protein